MRLADKLGAGYVIILGEDEIGARALTVRDMGARKDYPRSVAAASSAAELREALAQLSRRPMEERA